MSILLIALCAAASYQDEQQDPIYSGPQVGEPITAFEIDGVFGDQDAKRIDLVKQADNGPLLLMFVHQRTRPAFGLTNAMARYAASLEKGQLTAGICYLTKDTSEAKMWMKRIERYFNKAVTVGISPDGLEGPGEYGLNRNVAVTILVADKNKVAANFALIEPNLTIDGQKIIDATSKVLGTESPPKVTAFVNRAGNARMRAAGGQMNPELQRLLRRLINKQASSEQVKEAAAKIEDYLAKNPKQKSALGAACSRIVKSGRLETYGTADAQKHLKEWSEKLQTKIKQLDADRDQDDGRQ